MAERARGNEYRTTIVCVDDYTEEILSGRLYNPYFHEVESFHGVMSFLLKMEDLLDRMHLPQSFTSARSFGSQTEAEADRETADAARDGKCATFAVRVRFRQNASWQGSVTWLDKNREESFRSALELLLLIHSALGKS
jgi:hypothetical protein